MKFLKKLFYFLTIPFVLFGRAILWPYRRFSKKPTLEEEIRAWYYSGGKTANRGIHDMLADLLPEGSEPKIIKAKQRHDLISTKSYPFAKYREDCGALDVNIRNWSQDPLYPNRKIRNNWRVRFYPFRSRLVEQKPE